MVTGVYVVSLIDLTGWWRNRHKKAPSAGEGANRVGADRDADGFWRVQIRVSGGAGAALVAVQYPFQPGGQDRDRPVVVNGGVGAKRLRLGGMGADLGEGGRPEDADHDPAQRADRDRLVS